MNDVELMRLARRRVAMKRGFLIHLAVYVAVNALLMLLNVVRSPGVAWSAWPLAGWGIGLAVHGVVTWLFLPGSGHAQRMLDREIEALRGRR